MPQQPAVTAAVHPASQLSLLDLTRLAGEVNGVRLVYDATLLRDTVNVETPNAITPDELWGVASATLLTRGLCTVEIAPGWLSVTRIDQAYERAPLRSCMPNVSEQVIPSYIKIHQPVHHLPVTTAIEQLRSLGTQPLLAIQPGPQDSVIIAGSTERVQLAVDALTEIDRDDRKVVIRRIPLAVRTPQEVLSAVSEYRAKATTIGRAPLGEIIVPPGGGVAVLAPEADMAFWASYIQSLDTGLPRRRVVYDDLAFPLEDVAGLITELFAVSESGGRSSPIANSIIQPRIVQDILTGSLVVDATDEQHAEIVTVLQRLANTPHAERRPSRTFRINNRDVQELYDVLVSLVEAGAVDATFSAPSVGRPDAATPQAAQRNRLDATPDTLPQLSFAIDEGRNSLVVVGTPAQLDRIAALVTELDVRRPQVLLEVMLVSLNEGETLDFGIELQRLIESGGTLIRLSSLFGLSSLDLGDSDTSSTGGAGGTAVVLDPGNFSAVVRALQVINDGRSLSMPKVLVSDNQTATLDSVTEAPYLSTNASDTVATTTFGGSSEAGTQVTITPQIAEGDHLSLEYSVSLSAFVGDSADPALPPPRQQNSLSSVATIPDGYTVVVGGIELDTEAEGESKVPLLGDIPLLGEAFKSRSNSRSRARFYVFIRATILRRSGFEDLRYLSDRAGQDSGVDDGWPEVEPRVIR